jgi:hypothetical protein
MGEFAAVIGTSLPPDGVVQLPIKVDGPEVLLLIMKRGHEVGLSHEELGREPINSEWSVDVRHRVRSEKCHIWKSLS